MQSRRWYYRHQPSWLQYEEVEDADERADPAFEQAEQLEAARMRRTSRALLRPRLSHRGRQQVSGVQPSSCDAFPRGVRRSGTCATVSS